MTSEYIQANTDGTLHDAANASVSPLNRSFLYGDAVYEVWRSYDGIVYALDEHWQRLVRSADAVGINIPWSADTIFTQIYSTVQAYREKVTEPGELYIRLQISRGAGEIGLDSTLADQCRFVVLVRQLPPDETGKLEQGIRLSIAGKIRRNSRRCLDPAWKTGNYLNNIVGLRDAKTRGFDDVLFLNLQDELTEASTSNVAFIRDGKWITPPTTVGILPGITRARILSDVAERAGLEVEERVTLPSELADFDEAMLLSTTKDVQPVGCIDDIAYTTGPATVTRRLKDVFVQAARKYAALHPKLRV